MISLFCSILLLVSSVSVAADKVYTSEGQKFTFEVLTQQKDVIWGFDFLNKDQIIFTERGGKLKLFDLKTKAVTEVSGAPKVWSKGQGGLLDVRVHPKDKNKVYLAYSEPVADGSMTAVGFGTVEKNKLVNFKKIFTGVGSNDNSIHFGSRIDFDGKGHIFVSIGDRNDRDRAQSLEFHNGKIIRLKEDGTVPSDNPFLKNKKARPEIWSYGHRNPQGLVYHLEKNELWSSEMGPRGGDELNLITPGTNYGWPVITFGREYYGPKIGEGTAKKGMEQPVVQWTPSISPSAITIYTGSAFPKWKNNIFMANLSGEHLRRLKIDGQKVTAQEELLSDLSLRFRNVRTGPDGFLYISTDDGKIARLK